VHDLSGLRLDGDGDGVPGGDYVRTFTVTADGVAPKVVGVWVGGGDWSAGFRNYLQASGLGSAAYGFALAGGVDQLKSLPWANIDRVSIRFSEDVRVSGGDLALAGVNAAAYDVAGFVYDDVTFTATWTFARNLSTDKFALRLAAGTGGVTDVAGNRLDGEWTPAGNFPSGNGATGGDLVYRLNVNPGDGTRDGRTSAADQLQMRSRLAMSTSRPGLGTARYSVFYDLDGDGRIGAVDLAILRRNYLQALPPAEPFVAARVASSSSFDIRRVPATRALLGGPLDVDSVV
jgi:hypothetical protein